ncbi:PepSY domain-containing protein [Planococcus alpniumensis]|uniref:PepSY domain-containing protein n=1 Tax=Planococcus alpniumensis TaxID=2708345 RepID=UPI001B8BB894|nr:PepSY domain-containing protein [Planococcus sp. MSAK28401]
MKKLIYVSAAVGLLVFGGIVLADTDDTGVKLETQSVQGQQLLNNAPTDSSNNPSASGTATAESSAEEQSVKQFIGEQQAIEAAQSAAPGQVEDIERENEDGWVLYEVELKDGKAEYDVIIDASDGAVVSVEADDEDNDDNDDDYNDDDDNDDDYDDDDDNDDE